MINNTFVSKIFSEFEHKEQCAPDDYVYVPGKTKLNDNFVLCRKSDGTPTAIYGEHEWDLNPYRLSATRVSKMKFDSGLECVSLLEKEDLIAEMKYLMFCMMYFISTGHKGLLTPATLLNYFYMIRKGAQFCVRMKKRPVVGLLSLKELFSNKTYLMALCRENAKSVTFNKKMPALLNHLASLSMEKVGFAPVQTSELIFGSSESESHPIIPFRIYLGYMGELEQKINDIYKKSETLTSFLLEFRDAKYGCAKGTQKCNKVKKKDLRPTLQEAIEIYGLNALFRDTLQIKYKYSLPLVLTKVLYLVKNIIHLYTGMRSEEVLRLPYDCLIDHEVTEDTFDDNGNVVDKAQIVNLISTTTKFEGYKKSASWLATSEVIKAVTVAKRISKAVSTMKGIEPSKWSLFESTSIITHKYLSEPLIIRFKKNEVGDALNCYYIDKNDYDQLVASDPERNFQDNPLFQIGNPWHVTSHQYRRSLAFYASNSGLVSMPTIKRQFKHTSLAMSRYYSRNFENIKSIFGFYDEEKGEFVLPDGHMAYEFQMAMPINMADQIISDVLGDDNQLFGKTGGYIERQKKRLDNNEIEIIEVREDTIKRVDKGQLSYRSTLLGGCTKIGACDTAMLGEFTECLGCEGSVIKMDLVEKQINEVESELKLYDKGSFEFEIVSQDLDKLNKYKNRTINIKEV